MNENPSNQVSTTDPHFRLENVSKQYSIGRVEAIANIDLTVNPGDFVALLGPSGCGKSTLLNLLGAIDRPTSGEIWFGSRCISKCDDDELTEVRRDHIGFIFQFFNLISTLSVFENVSLPLELAGLKQSEIERRVNELLETFGLTERRQFYPTQLSGGEMQRVAIARAVIHEPDLIIADEPTGNLDTDNGVRVLKILAELNENKKRTIVMATHSAEASAYAKRIINMKDGRILSQCSV